ncbi:alpha/beta hydrolase [Salinicoccus carnicancri]|uniref:alpha/beta hydrolase n=1 Tax=Salinicoccus carnicancri TaxID=558170 RepID=UPI0002D48768|nr:alpha/beta fold hydrolase [Salinicoccus carnicancri]
MIEKNIHFYSEGLKLRGTLYYPENIDEKGTSPAIIANSGYQGFNEFYPRMFAKKMTEAGYICLGFDYRGFADSEGEKGTVLIEQQVEDINNAVTFLQFQEEVDHNRIGLIGWGMGAANVILVTENNENVAAVASLNGFYNGERWLKSIHSYKEWIQILETVKADRIQRVVEGESQLVDPFIHYPLDPATKDYVEKELSSVYGFGYKTRLQFTESIINLNAERSVQEIESTPLFIGHGEENILHPYEEALALYDSACSPKTLFTIKGKHNDFMYSDHPEFNLLCKHLVTFFERAFEHEDSRIRKENM